MKATRSGRTIIAEFSTAERQALGQLSEYWWHWRATGTPPAECGWEVPRECPRQAANLPLRDCFAGCTEARVWGDIQGHRRVRGSRSHGTGQDRQREQLSESGSFSLWALFEPQWNVRNTAQPREGQRCGKCTCFNSFSHVGALGNVP